MIVIIGGGITGLAAAYELAARGVPFRLFEASPRLGGLIRTEHVDGFTIEAGPDSMLAQKPAAIELCQAVGLGPRLISTTPPRTAFVLRRGRLHRLPSPSVLGLPISWRGIASYDLLSIPGRVRLAMEPWIRRERHDDESVGSFFRRRFGASTVGLVAEPLLGGIHAGDIETLSIASLFPRLVEAEAKRGSVLRALHAARTPRADTEGLFRSLAGGMSELVTAIERRLPPESARCDAPVTAIARDGDVWRVSAGGVTTSAGAVLIAAPAHVAGGLLTPMDERAGALCAQVPYVSTASVALAWPRHVVRHALAGSGFVVARRHNALRITACTWVSSKWSGRAPAGSVLLRAFLGGSHDPGVVDLPDAALVDTAVRELSQVLGITGPPTVARVYRWRGAGAQHHVGHIARVREIESRLSNHHGLFVAGSGFHSVGIPDCVADGRAAASRAAESIKMKTHGLSSGSA